MPSGALITTLRASMLACLTLTACGDGTTSELTCTAEVDDCSRGLFFGTCRGSRAEPTIACSEGDGHCAWFTGGCPRIMRPIACPIDDPCCHGGPDGPWPYEDWMPDRNAPQMIQALQADVAAIGTRPLTRTSPSDLEVTVDPTIAARPYAEVVCAPGTPLDVCGTAPLSRSTYRFGESIVVRLGRTSFFGETIYVDLVPDGPAPIARVFVREDDDDFTYARPIACIERRRFAFTGTLRVNTLEPESLHGVIDATVDGTWPVVFRF